MKFQDIAKRVNAAYNFFADTVNEDYLECLTKQEVLDEDKANKEIFFLFKQELSKCGY